MNLRTRLGLRRRLARTLAGFPPCPLPISSCCYSLTPSPQALSVIPALDPTDDDHRDGVVACKSAHLDCIESELVVRSAHSCQDKPDTIREVRRILLQHLAELETAGVKTH